jgi:hypothetical protein
MTFDEQGATAFALAVCDLEAYREHTWSRLQAIQSKLNAALRASWRKHCKGKRFDDVKVREILPDWQVIYDAHKAPFDLLWHTREDETERRETALRESAAAEIIPRVDQGHAEPYKSYLFTSACYGSQGWGAAKYARGEATLWALKAQHYGVRAEVVELRNEPYQSAYGGGSHVEYGVRCDTNELGHAVLERLPALSLRDWVKACWANQINPRVLDPFLPHGIEEKLGVDYFGRDITKGEQAHEESSTA